MNLFIRRNPAFALLFASFFAAGLVSILTVQKFQSLIQSTIEKKSKQLTGADLVVNVRRPFTSEELRAVEGFARDQNLFLHRRVDYFAMLQSQERAPRLVEVRVVEDGYPHYGKKIWDLLPEQGLIAAPELDLKSVTKIRFLDQTWKYTADLEESTLQSFSGFSIAPLVYVKWNAPLASLSSLPGYTSQHSLSLSFKNPDASSQVLESTHRELRRILPATDIRILTDRQSAERFFQGLRTVTSYLSLLGLISFLLSFIGILYQTEIWLDRRAFEVALWKLWGASPSVVAKKLAHEGVVFLGLGALLSILVVYGILPFGLHWIRPYFPLLDISLLPGRELLWGTGLCGFVSFFCLFRVRELSWNSQPYELLQSDGRSARNTPFWNIPKTLFTAVVLTIISIALTHSWKIGLLFSAGLWISILGISAILRVGLHSLQSLKSFRFPVSFWKKYFFSSLSLYAAMSLGSALLILPLILEHTLHEEISLKQGTRRPDYFLFDLQDEQLENFHRWSAEEAKSQEGYFEIGLSPLLRGQLISVNGELLASRNQNAWRTQENEVEEQFSNRVFNFSIREKLSDSETIVKGEDFWPKPTEDNLIPFSLEQKFAQSLRVKIGDVLGFKVLDRDFQARVVSLRKVRWTQFQPNFFVLTSPGAFDLAPKTWMLSVGGIPSEKRNAFLSRLSARFPNVSAVNVQDSLSKIEEFSGLILKSNLWISLLTCLGGMTVFFGVLLFQIRSRTKEFALYRLLSPTSREWKSYFRKELWILLGLSLVLGNVIALASGGTLAVYGFNSAFSFPAGRILGVNLLLLFLFHALVEFLLHRSEKKSPLILLQESSREAET